ncbi:hypothetical protein DFH29DRAFT_871796 [Suillus ampliporus]|nr:hypothetical protein DFH29DRAFT_871796 [Suillus ampliporus]
MREDYHVARRVARCLVQNTLQAKGNFDVRALARQEKEMRNKLKSDERSQSGREWTARLHREQEDIFGADEPMANTDRPNGRRTRMRRQHLVGPTYKYHNRTGSILKRERSIFLLGLAGVDSVKFFGTFNRCSQNLKSPVRHSSLVFRMYDSLDSAARDKSGKHHSMLERVWHLWRHRLVLPLGMNPPQSLNSNTECKTPYYKDSGTLGFPSIRQPEPEPEIAIQETTTLMHSLGQRVMAEKIIWQTGEDDQSFGSNEKTKLDRV